MIFQIHFCAELCCEFKMVTYCIKTTTTTTKPWPKNLNAQCWWRTCCFKLVKKNNNNFIYVFTIYWNRSLCEIYWCIREQLSFPVIFFFSFILPITPFLTLPILSSPHHSSPLILSLLLLLAPQLTNEIRQSRGVSGAKPELQWPGALAYSNILLREKEGESNSMGRLFDVTPDTEHTHRT